MEKENLEYQRGNCPFCDAERGFDEGWGFSEEGWQQAKERHYKYHIKKCPSCGQSIKQR